MLSAGQHRTERSAGFGGLSDQEKRQPASGCRSSKKSRVMRDLPPRSGSSAGKPCLLTRRPPPPPTTLSAPESPHRTRGVGIRAQRDHEAPHALALPTLQNLDHRDLPAPRRGIAHVVRDASDRSPENCRSFERSDSPHPRIQIHFEIRDRDCFRLMIHRAVSFIGKSAFFSPEPSTSQD
jgi:hypothetical protein